MTSSAKDEKIYAPKTPRGTHTHKRHAINLGTPEIRNPKTNTSANQYTNKEQRRMYVFISHASQDRFVAKKIAEELNKRGISCFIDANSLVAGMDIQEKIAEKLKETTELLVIWTPAAAESSWVRREVEVARLMNRLITPILYGTQADSLPDAIRTIRAINLDGLQEYYSEATNRLCKEIVSSSSNETILIPHPYGEFRVSNNRAEMWQLWTSHARSAVESILTTTRSVGEISSKATQEERAWRRVYYETLQVASTRSLDMRLLALANPEKLEELFERRRAGLTVRVHPTLFDQLEFRYQIVDEALIVLNIPHVPVRNDSEFADATSQRPSERSVAFHNHVVATDLREQFEIKWNSKEAIDLVEFARRLLLDLLGNTRKRRKSIRASLGMDDRDVQEILDSLVRDGVLAVTEEFYSIVDQKKHKAHDTPNSIGNTAASQGSPSILEPNRPSDRADLAGLIEECNEAAQRIDLKMLRNAGIRPSLQTEFWPGHTIVTYPFHDDLRAASDIDSVIQRISQPSSGQNIYIHIPYCVGICNYCAYSKAAIGSISQMRKIAYTNAICDQIEIEASRGTGSNTHPNSLYIGGGTPTALDVSHFENFINRIGRIVQFQCLEESTCECSPETIIANQGTAKLGILKDAGFTRISMGVESFSEKVTAEMGRGHGPKDAIKAVETILSMGFRNLNIDLIYGLPGQDDADFVNTLKTAISLGVPSITLYPFRVKRKSIWGKRFEYEENENEFDWAASRHARLALIGTRILNIHGYRQESVHWFLKDNDRGFRHQRAKYEMKELRGFGCSAYSFANECQFYNVYDEIGFMNAVSKGECVISVGRVLTKSELGIRYLIFGLKRGFFADEFASKFHMQPGDFAPILRRLQAVGVLEVSNGNWELSELGKLFADEVGVALHHSVGSCVLQ